MTERLYYDDSFAVDFEAAVVERLTVGQQPAVVLDRTCFYPEGGGQPADTGTIGGVPVRDVQSRAEDAAVLHILEAPLPTDQVSGHVDWERRFDHMQHHTGQHILTQAFVQLHAAHTVGFHLSSDTVTIDLDRAPIPADVLLQVEQLANRIITEDRPVSSRLVPPNQADNVRMRRPPDHLLTDGLRVIEIEDFDRTACGGTHVSRTGQIGLLKIVKLESKGDGTRVEFLCGGRALSDYQQKHTILTGLAADLPTGYWDVPAVLDRLRDELNDTQSALRAASQRLIEHDARRLLAAAPDHDGVRVVTAAIEQLPPADVRALASLLVEEPGVIALLGVPGEGGQLIFARSADLSYDMNETLQRAFEELGEGRGGGRPDFAQGGGFSAGTDRVNQALDAAHQHLLSL